jgi:tetratricopeptide (TPR) repeat protein
LSEDVSGEYTCHDLLRAYAAELGAERDPAQARDQAMHRLLDHYLHTAATAVRRYSVHRPPIVLPDPRPGVSIPDVTTPEQASAWFDARHGVLLELVGRTAASGRYDAYVWRLTWTLHLFLHGRGLWHDLLALNQTAMAAATRLDDPVARGHMHAGMGRALASLRRLDEASDHMRRALELFERAADPEIRAEHRRTFSWVLEQQGQYDAALTQAEQALRLLQGSGHRARWAIALNAVGWYQALLGRYQEALESCRRALAALEDLGEQRSQADVWDSLGFVHQQRGEYGAAVEAYERALTIWHLGGIRYAESATLVRLGEACRAAGDRARAEAAWRQALTLLIELDHPDAAHVRGMLDESGPAPE